MKKHYAHIVKWRDSSITRGWRDINDPGHVEVALITSIGWVFHNSKKEITLTTSISRNGNVVDALTIPRECIVSMTRLPKYILE